MSKVPQIDRDCAVAMIVGGDLFFRVEALGQLLADMGDAGEVSITRYHGDQTQAADVFDDVRTQTLMGGRPVVIVDDADGFVSRYRERLLAYVQQPCTTGTLILLCQSEAKTTKLRKLIDSQHRVIELPQVKPWEMSTWIRQRAKDKYGKKMDIASSDRLVDAVGPSPGLLDAQLHKLAIYVGNRLEITEKDIHALIVDSREETVFKVIEAVLSQDAASALAYWDQVMATDKAVMHRSVGGMAWKLRDTIQQSAGGKGGGYGRKTPVHPSWTPERLSALQEHLLSIDVATKTSASDIRLGIERMIVLGMDQQNKRDRRTNVVPR